MEDNRKILPGTGRWQSAGLTEGPHLAYGIVLQERWAPSTMLRMVPLPVPGRI